MGFKTKKEQLQKNAARSFCRHLMDAPYTETNFFLFQIITQPHYLPLIV